MHRSSSNTIMYTFEAKPLGDYINFGVAILVLLHLRLELYPAFLFTLLVGRL